MGRGQVEVGCDMRGCPISSSDGANVWVRCSHLRCPHKDNPWFFLMKMIGQVTRVFARQRRLGEEVPVVEDPNQPRLF